MRKKATKAEMPQAFTDEAIKEASENGKGQKLTEKGEKPLLRKRYGGDMLVEAQNLS